MLKFLKYLYQFFITINIYEYKSKGNKILRNRTETFFIKSVNEIKYNKQVIEYFKRYKFKLNRFKKKSKFIGLKYKNKLICSGWIFFGNNCKWNVEEINKKISLKKQYILYDFETEKELRNKGYYQLLLKFIQNKFNNKKLIIYALSHNPKSNRAIKNAGFKFKNKLKKF